MVQRRWWLWPLIGLLTLWGCQDCSQEPREVRSDPGASEAPSLQVVARGEAGAALGVGVGLPGERALVAVQGRGAVASVEPDGQLQVHDLGSKALGGLYRQPDGSLLALEFAGDRVLWLKELADAVQIERQIQAGQGPRLLTWGQDHGWVLTRDPARSLVRLQGESAEVVKAPGSTQADLLWTQGRLWIANLASHDLTLIEPGAEPRRLPVAPEPYRLVELPDARQLLVLHNNSPEVTVLDAQGERKVARYTAPWIPTDAVSVGQGRVALLSAGAGALWVGAPSQLGQEGAGWAQEIPVGSTDLLWLPEGWLVVATGGRGGVKVWRLGGGGEPSLLGELELGFAVGRLWEAPGSPGQFWALGPQAGRVARCAIGEQEARGSDAE